MSETKLKLTVRSANLNDADRLAQLCEQLGYPMNEGEVRSRLERALDNPKKATLVAENELGKVQGFIDLEIREGVVAGPLVENCGLVVDTEVRGVGAGKALVLAAEKWCLEKGLTTMMLKSNIVRTEAHEFYKRLGYDNKKTQYTFSKKLNS